MFTTFKLPSSNEEMEKYADKVKEIGLPSGVTTRLVINDNANCYYKIYFNENPTLFYIDGNAKIIIWNSINDTIIPVSRSGLLYEYEEFLKDEKNCAAVVNELGSYNKEQ